MTHDLCFSNGPGFSQRFSTSLSSAMTSWGTLQSWLNILQRFWMLKVLVDSGRNASNNSILEEFLRILRRDWGFELPVVAGPGQGGEVSTSGGAGAQDWPGQGRLMIHWFIDFLMIYDTWHIYMYHHVLSCVYDSLNFPFGIRAWKLQMALGTIQFPSKTKMTRPFLHVLVA